MVPRGGLGGDLGRARGERAVSAVPNPIPDASVPTPLSFLSPYLLFLGDTTEPGFAKTAFGLRDWAREKCVGEFALPGASVSAGLPQLRPGDAGRLGAKSLVIGVANVGGIIGPAWIPALLEAIAAGLDIVSGLHARLDDVPELVAAARKHGRRLIDIRRPPDGIPVGTGRKRTGKRLLTVGTDCVVGKKYSALTIAGSLRARGIDAHFRATGQTGIMIDGGGIPIDAVVSDFVSGAAEMLSPDADQTHWDVIEGQGSLFHPSFAAVSLGLLHGSQPDVVIVCHDPARLEMLGRSGFAVPTIEETIALNLELGRRTNPSIRCGGVSLNTAALPALEAERLIARESDRLGCPVADPLRGGRPLETLIDACVQDSEANERRSA